MIYREQHVFVGHMHGIAIVVLVGRENIILSAAVLHAMINNCWNWLAVKIDFSIKIDELLQDTRSYLGETLRTSNSRMPVFGSQSLNSFVAAVLQFLSVGPDLVAIWGLKAKKYLAVDNKGRIFATVRSKNKIHSIL